MKHALESESSPLDANLESVLPGVHQWHQANESALRQLASGIERMGNELGTKMETFVGTMATGQQESEERLAESFFQIAEGILARRGLKRRSPASPSLSEEEEGERPTRRSREDSPATVDRSALHRPVPGKFSTLKLQGCLC